MEKLLLLLMVFLQIDLFAVSQTDSLQNLLPELEGEEKVGALLQLSQLDGSNDTAKSLAYLRESISISKQLEKPALLAKAYLSEADYFFNIDDYLHAIPLYEQTINLYQELDSTQLIGEIYNSIGLSYYYLGEFEKALASQIEAVKNFEESANLRDLTRIYINMGMVYNRLGDYNSAVQYYRKASQIAETTGDIERLGNSYNGLGTGNYNAGRLDSAKFYYRKAQKYFTEVGNEQRLAAVINNLGNIYTDEGDSLEVGLSYYQKAYDIYSKHNDLRNKVFVMEGLGCVYSELGNLKKALQIFNEGLKTALANNYGYYITQLYYEDIATVYEREGKIEQAFSAYKTYKLYLDSMRQEERLWQATAIEKKYEFTKSEALISRLNAEKELAMIQLEKDKAFRNLGVFAILILLIIITYVSFGNYNRKRINRILVEKNIQIEAQRNELEQLNASKNRFFSIIAHDLKNPLHTVLGYSFLLHHEYDRFSDKDKKKYARDIYNSTNNIFRLLQNLLDWSRSQTGRLKYEPMIFELSSLQEKICNLLKPVSDQKNISLNYEVPGNIHVYATPMMVETVLRNLVSNAVKFTPDGGSVSISFKRYERDISVCVKDTGIGMTESELEQLFAIDSKIKKKGTNNEDGSGLGLILCKEFIQLNKGKIWAESQAGKGSTFCFTVPLALEDS
ncbi:ATP-binding protein [Mangrovibacterium lignilyticum]|uniref:ATP-binding protein n=1 Tax=Mangrovibacterium lignilyticum TaxID=2668052 RepID=UPI0013D7DF8B|nr:tetratricopeptide repeat-containing sensor histidine kinase [Mangrovibacterium lignilyticum]